MAVETRRLRDSEIGSSWPLWLWPNLLSLDAPLLAVLWLSLFASSAHIHMPWFISLLMGVVVWLIYVADRLFDALRSGKAEMRPARHRFYGQHRVAFGMLLVALFGFAAWGCFALAPDVRAYGAVLMLVVCFYLLIVQRVQSTGKTWFPKEPAVGVLFGLGTYLPVLASSREFSVGAAISVMLFMLVCWLNAVLIEFVEWVGLRDGNRDRPHASTIATGRHLSIIASLVAVIAMAVTLPATFRGEFPIFLAVALSAGGLAMLG